MPRRIIDISVALTAGIASDPSYMLPAITYLDHAAGAENFMQVFPGLKREQLPDNAGPAVEQVAISTHNGTHLDAPYHFHPTMDNGKPAMTIDQVCTADDMERALDRIGHQLKPLDIVLANTNAGKAYGQPDFIDRGCGFGREATLFLLKQGVRVTGTNGWSWDAPFSYTARRFAETGDASLIWEGHKAGREIGYCHMEKLSNLDALPASGFQVACFPVKIAKASAGWTRAVAILES
jgi:kynurenine formamidase